VNVQWTRKVGLIISIVAAAALVLLLFFNLAQAERSAALDSVSAPTLVSFQGKVTANGSPYQGVGYFKFAIVNAAGDTSYWSNDNTSVAGSAPTAIVPLNVTNGLFTVLLGDTTQGGMSAPLNASVFAAPDRHLRVWFSTTGLTGSFEQLTPDYAIGAVPFALNAETLDGLDSSAFAASVHTHDGADIVTGTLPDTRLSSNVVLDGQGVSRLNNDTGYITQTLADVRYARRSPTTQQIAMLKWYTAITGTGSIFAVGGNPDAAAFDGENIWVSNRTGNSVSVLRANDGTLVMTIPTGWWPYGLAFDGTNMWVPNNSSGNVSVLRARDGYHVMTITLGSSPTDVAFDGANVWVANYLSGNISVLRASDGARIMTPTVSGQPVALAFDGAAMWAANFSGNTVSVLRASDGYRIMTPTVGSAPRRLAFDGVNMWVANWSSNNVSVLRASDGYHVMTISVGTQPCALAFDGANMWVANNGSNSVSVLRASDGALITTVPVGLNPSAIAFDGAFMWIANDNSSNIYKR
jgi:YVTN family beta-propeller protein